MPRTPHTASIGVIGLGYVGLPLAVAFGRQQRVVGFDVNAQRIRELEGAQDRTREVDSSEILAAKHLTFTTDAEQLHAVDVYIVTTPTPIDEFNNPDLRSLIAATRTVGNTLKRGNVVIYESTVYPGATEEDCVPVLEAESGLTFNDDFFVGYSPERINPGDKEHRFESILKVTSGSTTDAARFVDELYASVITAGTHLAPSIRVAEAAKVIENVQRDVNIALVNEFALLFSALGIETRAVLDAAATKWNFLPFRPGLVGGHCIGVDPYYLTHKAKAVNYHPEIILAGRRINDSMGQFVARRMVKLMLSKRIDLRDARILILGLTFKENTPDLRNTKVTDIKSELENFGLVVDVYDPWVDPEEARKEYGISPTDSLEGGSYDGIIVAVGHEVFREMGTAEVRALGKAECAIFDLKYILEDNVADERL